MHLDKIEDTRTPLDRLRRVELLKILKDNDQPAHPNTPATALRIMIQSSGIDIHKPPKKVDVLELGWQELRAYVGSKGIKVMPSDKREDLLAKLGVDLELDKELEAINGENAT